MARRARQRAGVPRHVRGRPTTSRSTSRSPRRRPVRARRERRARTRARLLGRGAHDRRGSARHRGSRDRRRCPRRERARSAPVPGVLVDDRVARRDEGAPGPRRRLRARRRRRSCTQGDWIVGDADGVTVVPHAQLDDVLARRSGTRAAKEAQFFEELRAGRTTIAVCSASTRARSTRDVALHRRDASRARRRNAAPRRAPSCGTRASTSSRPIVSDTNLSSGKRPCR